MFSAFRMGPAASGLYDIDRVLLRITKSRVKKIGKSGHGENIPMKIEKAKLSVHFRRARTSHFSETSFSN